MQLHVGFASGWKLELVRERREKNGWLGGGGGDGGGGGGIVGTWSRCIEGCYWFLFVVE